ncbi:MAG: hypothetical protein EAZ74_02080 [Alphaproteobacteria bacterium]|nr:MAG: hypothetical protein EAZ74_02080 [Alphaproteobacteria bacterium]
MTENNKYDPDSISRIIMLVYGTMEHGGPFWCYVAVKPSMYDAFKNAERAGSLDLLDFDSYGEIIVSAEGEVPPDEVTIKVAEMYGADASKFFQPIDPKKVIEEKIEELRRSDEEQDQASGSYH